MGNPMFSIIVVALNAGDKLIQTVESIRRQSCHDLEVVVKDGGSSDGSVMALKELKQQGLNDEREFWERVRIIEQPDKSIYEGMNQAAGYAEGKYLYFLNCGDYFYSDQALEELKRSIVQYPAGAGQVPAGSKKSPAIFYGDIYDALRDNRVASNPHIDGFACYRNVPCHQACVYDRVLFSERGYEPKYRVRADYEHFLWCFYRKQAAMVYVPVILASYEGGGFSETAENRKKSAKEHAQITALYMSKGELLRYRMIMALTLAPLRTKMAESQTMSGCYNRLKNFLYRRK